MPEQRADHVQTNSGRGEMAGVGVPQIMDTQCNDPRGLANSPPGLFHAGAVAAVAPGEDKDASALDAREEHACRCRKRDAMLALLLRARVWLGPNAGREVDVGPLRGQRLA